MKNLSSSLKIIYGSLIVIAIIIVGGAYLGYNRYTALSNRADFLAQSLSELDANLASTTNRLEIAINQTNSTFSSALSAQSQNVGNIQQQLGNFQNQVGTISGTVNTLQKLAKTDPELLKKYSKIYFLSDNYVPARLAEIPNQYVYSNTKTLLIQTDVLPKLQSMIDNASTSGIALYTFSAYRSFAEQRALKGQYTVTYGAGTANSFSADQGYSEHQLGTTVDLITSGLGGDLDGFDKTAAFRWIVDNGYKYGFVMSYPANNSYFVYEPWHWRFVGVKLATYLHNNGITFYNLDQRTIDEYLVSIFD